MRSGRYSDPGAMPPLVFYHQGCPDGFCAAWVFRKKFPDAEFVPVTHGDAPPKVCGRNVWILDFHFKRPLMTELRSRNLSLELLDHHETAFRELEGFKGAAIDLSKSGARLTLERFCGPGPFPWSWIIDYTEDRDLWRNRLPGTEEINAAIASYPRTFEAWDEIAANGYGPLFLDGKVILRYKRQLIARVVAQAFEETLDGHHVAVANCGVSNLESEVAGTLAEGRPFGAVYSESGNRRKWSLRSKDGGVNVARIAERFGGGGHDHAAGFNEKKGQPFWQGA